MPTRHTSAISFKPSPDVELRILLALEIVGDVCEHVKQVCTEAHLNSLLQLPTLRMVIHKVTAGCVALCGCVWIPHWHSMTVNVQSK